MFTREMDVVWDAPFRVAVMIAVWFAVRVPVVALKEPVELPDVTVTEEGTVRAALLLDSEIVMPPEGAV